MIARGITVDRLNFYQPRKKRIIVLQCHGFAPKLIRPLGVCGFLCLKGSRSTRRAPLNITDNDFEIDKEVARF